MKLPEPVAYLTDSPEHKELSFFLSRDPRSKQEPLYTETQVKDMLAQADKDVSDLMLIVHMKQAAKYDPVLREARYVLEDCRDGCESSHDVVAAIQAIKEVLK